MANWPRIKIQIKVMEESPIYLWENLKSQDELHTKIDEAIDRVLVRLQ